MDGLLYAKRKGRHPDKTKSRDKNKTNKTKLKTKQITRRG